MRLLKLFSPLITLSQHHLWVFSSFACVISYWEEERSSLFTGVEKISPWQRWARAALLLHKARQALVPPSQWPLVSVMLPNRLCALHFVPAPSYGRVRWDYVQNSLRGAGAYTSHHKSDSHWDACNTTPVETDKPSILPFYSTTHYSPV